MAKDILENGADDEIQKAIKTVFDKKHYVRFDTARLEFLNKFLPTLVKEHKLQTALDVGCGLGFFSKYLSNLNLKVLAFDARQENITEASGRNPDIEFKTGNIEDSALSQFDTYDLVFCFGLLYHLENPFRAIRNLAALTRKLLIIETMIVPFRQQLTVLREENIGQDQSLNYIVSVPSESWFIKCLYKSGFSFVYKTRILPNHAEFRSSLLRKKMRTCLIAAKIELEHPILKLVPYPKRTNRYMWHRFGGAYLAEYEWIRNLKVILSKLLSKIQRKKPA